MVTNSKKQISKATRGKVTLYLEGIMISSIANFLSDSMGIRRE